jgi:hypothetical protein
MTFPSETILKMVSERATISGRPVVLGYFEGAIAWWIGDWWIYGQHKYGKRAAIVKSADWRGPTFQTCSNYGLISRGFEQSRRRDRLTFAHHREVIELPLPDQERILDAAQDKHAIAALGLGNK